MSFDIDFFRKLSGSYEVDDQREERNSELSKQISYQYEHTVNGFAGLVESMRGTACYINKPLDNYFNNSLKETRILIDYNKNLLKADVSPFQREVAGYFNTLHSGDYITYNNVSTGKEDTFLINTLITNELHNDKCYMELCNNSISWMDDKGNLYTIPCIIASDTSMDNIYYGEINTLKRMRKMSIPNNELTNNFRVDMSFIFNHKDKFKITTIDRNTIPGLLNIIIIDEAVNEEIDNLELNIADYIKLKNDYSIKVLTENNDNYLSATNNVSQVLHIELQDNDEIIDLSDSENKEILNQIICKSDNENIVTIKNDGKNIILYPHKVGQCNILVGIENLKGMESTLVTNKYLTSVTEENVIDNYTIEVLDKNEDFTVRPSLNDTFTAILKKNGVEILDTSFKFYIRNKDSSEFVLLGQIIKTTKNSCTIKCNPNRISGILILTVKDISNLIIKEVEIQVKKLNDL